MRRFAAKDTKARRRAFVSFAANRRIHALWQSTIPSRFVGELPEADVERIVQPGLWGGRGQINEYDQTYEWRAPPLAAARRPPLTITAKAELVPPRPSPSVAFAAGERVFHEKFGYGTVRSVEAGKLDVEFSTGRKKVMDSFVRRA